MNEQAAENLLGVSHRVEMNAETGWLDLYEREHGEGGWMLVRSASPAAWLADMDALKARVEELEQLLGDWSDEKDRVLDEACPPHETHCSCVLHLRRRIAALQDDAERIAGLRDIDAREIGELRGRVAELQDWRHYAQETMDAIGLKNSVDLLPSAVKKAVRRIAELEGNDEAAEDAIQRCVKANERIAEMEKENEILSIKAQSAIDEMEEIADERDAALKREGELDDWLGQVANCSGLEDTPEDQADVEALCHLVATAHDERADALRERDAALKRVKTLEDVLLSKHGGEPFALLDELDAARAENDKLRAEVEELRSHLTSRQIGPEDADRLP